MRLNVNRRRKATKKRKKISWDNLNKEKGHSGQPMGLADQYLWIPGHVGGWSGGAWKVTRGIPASGRGRFHRSSVVRVRCCASKS